jgi:hypothetical protein
MTNTAERITQHIREQGCAQSYFTTTLQRFNLRQIRLFHVSAYHNIIQLPQLPHDQLQRSAAARSSKTFEVSFVAPSSLACANPITSGPTYTQLNRKNCNHRNTSRREIAAASVLVF